MQQNTEKQSCNCFWGQRNGCTWRYQCHQCNQNLCDECYSRCSDCHELLCESHSWFCTHCETWSCYKCSQCYVTEKVEPDSQNFYCYMCLSRLENEALMGDDWERIEEQVSIGDNTALYVTHSNASQ